MWHFTFLEWKFRHFGTIIFCFVWKSYMGRSVLSTNYCVILLFLLPFTGHICAISWVRQTAWQQVETTGCFYTLFFLQNTQITHEFIIFILEMPTRTSKARVIYQFSILYYLSSYNTAVFCKALTHPVLNPVSLDIKWVWIITDNMSYDILILSW